MISLETLNWATSIFIYLKKLDLTTKTGLKPCKVSDIPLDIEPIVTDSANPLTLPEDPITVDEPDELAKRDIDEAKRRNRRSVEFFPFDTPPEEILETLKNLDAEPPIDEIGRAHV